MKKIKKVFCFLTGGHRYKDENMKVTEIKKGTEYIFENYCCKCGKRMVHIIDIEDILNGLRNYKFW